MKLSRRSPVTALRGSRPAAGTNPEMAAALCRSHSPCSQSAASPSRPHDCPDSFLCPISSCSQHSYPPFYSLRNIRNHSLHNPKPPMDFHQDSCFPSLLAHCKSRIHLSGHLPWSLPCDLTQTLGHQSSTRYSVCSLQIHTCPLKTSPLTPYLPLATVGCLLTFATNFLKSHLHSQFPSSLAFYGSSDNSLSPVPKTAMK